MKKCYLFLLLFISLEIRAQIPKEFITLFQTEKFQEGIEYLNSLENSKVSESKKIYLLGLCYSRLQQYDLAINYFKKAEKLGHQSSEFNYEYGQALYANNNLYEARFEFNTSAGKKYKFVESVYYVAYISELLEDLITAKGNYRKIIKNKTTDNKMRQIAIFQYTKILLKMMKREDRSQNLVKLKFTYLDVNLANYIPRYIIPLLDKALAVDPTSSVADEIRQTTTDLMQEYQLDPNVLENGRRIHSKRYYANLSIGMKQDSNVELIKKSSSAYEIDLYGKYDYVFKKKMIFSPELRILSTKYTNNTDPDIYQYNSLSLTPALKNKYEHTFRDKPASFLVDFEYTSGFEDWHQSHNVQKYSDSYSVTLGEQLTLSELGDSYFKIRKTTYTDQGQLSDYERLGFSFDQYTFLSDGSQLLVSTIDYSKMTYENELLSYDTYLLRFIHIFLEPIPTYSFQTILGASLVDTKQQKDQRGMEFNFNPSIEVTKNFTDRIKLAINYSYVSNSSKDENYKYHRQIIGTNLNYSF